MDQKTGGELGGEKITLVSLLTLPNMELSHQPLSLKNSGPESKLIVSIRLKVKVSILSDISAGGIKVDPRLFR
jgi:hypothetical protein